MYGNGPTLANFAIGANDLATAATLHYDKDSYSTLNYTQIQVITIDVLKVNRRPQHQQ